jgi:hypothetical protein
MSKSPEMDAAMESGPVVYSGGDLVVFSGKLCVVQDITPVPLGFNRYSVSNVETGELYSAQKHQLEKFMLDDDAEVLEVSWDEPIVLDSDHTLSLPEPAVSAVPSTSRHAVLSDKELDLVANQRLALNTENQTKWAVNLFKGK